MPAWMAVRPLQCPHHPKGQRPFARFVNQIEPLFVRETLKNSHGILSPRDSPALFTLTVFSKKMLRDERLVPGSAGRHTELRDETSGTTSFGIGESFVGLHPSGSRGESRPEKKIRHRDKTTGEFGGLEQHSPTHPKYL
ncbi:hypothetical protein LR48_Vigan09g044900 [Vigna angularis]|uniref:Uncharacterized protein n=1 Tax=Phaseolus angularis TaxID=3914 RepID=A0A0L9V9L6_PHAAN|nr:hypothetical protein LR48_Vigan09g044900 [Vigna angularis]